MALPPNSLPHPQFPDYFVTPEGEIWSVKRETPRLLAKRLHKGYYNVGGDFGVTSKNTKRVTYSIHRLVAETFIPNPHNLTDVNHINGDKTDNSVSNLEWCSRRYNHLHARRIGIHGTQYEYKVMVCATGETFWTPSLSVVANAFCMQWRTLRGTLKTQKTRLPLRVVDKRLLT